MDDYQDREFPGIEAAVLDFAERDRPRRFVPFLAGGNKMFLCFAPLVAVYQRALLQQANFKDVCRLTRIRDFNVLISRSKLPVDSEKILVQISSSNFPKRAESELSLNQKSQKFSQIKFALARQTKTATSRLLMARIVDYSYRTSSRVRHRPDSLITRHQGLV